MKSVRNLVLSSALGLASFLSLADVPPPQPPIPPPPCSYQGNAGFTFCLDDWTYCWQRTFTNLDPGNAACPAYTDRMCVFDPVACIPLIE